MARAQHTTSIGGFQYTTTALGAKEGRRVFVRLAKILGPGLEGGEGAKVLSGILNALSAEDFDFFCDVFAVATRVQTTSTTEPLLSDVFDNHFAGQYGEMVRWLGWCFEVNYSSFLGGFGLDLGKLKEKAVQKLNSPPIVTGPSGD